MWRRGGESGGGDGGEMGECVAAVGGFGVQIAREEGGRCVSVRKDPCVDAVDASNGGWGLD